MADDVERWSAENDWDTKREMKEAEEEGLDTALVAIRILDGQLRDNIPRQRI